MATLAIDINDASLVVAHEGEVLAREPGYALVEDGRIITGTAVSYTHLTLPTTPYV